MANETEVKEVTTTPVTKSVKTDEVVTINIQPFLMPVSILLSAMILAVGFIVGMNNLGVALKGSASGTGTTTGTGTTPPPTTAGTATSVTLDQIRGLWDNSAAITLGNKDSNLLLVEFSDTSCPYCHIASGKNPELNKSVGTQFTLVADGGTYVAPIPEFKKLVDEGKAGFAYVYATGHGNGKLGNAALFCARDQGKFWEVHDLLMSAAGYDMVNETVKNDTANAGKLAEFLQGVVDSSFMTDCLSTGKYTSNVDAGDQVASSFGVSGTPGMFVNTTNFAGAYSFTDMQSAVDSALGV